MTSFADPGRPVTGGVDTHKDAHVAVRRVWEWLSAPAHSGLLNLWVEGYARSLVEPAGAWAGFGAQTVSDWLELLAEFQFPAIRRSARGAAQRTQVLAVLRGALLDLLATGDHKRTTDAVHQHLDGL